MSRLKLVEVNEKIAENVTEGFNNMSSSVVTGFNKMSDAVVGGYTKIEDKFVDRYLRKEDETVEEAKARLKAEEKARREEHEAMMMEHRDKANSVR